MQRGRPFRRNHGAVDRGREPDTPSVGKNRPVRGRQAGWAVACMLGGCAAFAAPVRPDVHRLGCYRLETSLDAYADSLGYRLPEVFQLGYSEHGQWTVLPTDPDWHPEWTVYDGLPSGYLRRETAHRASGPMQWDSISRIPGDSFDVHFPSAIGSLVLRFGGDGDRLGGRAEWPINRFESYLNDGARVVAHRTSCEALPLALERTREP